jgi:hypothetical protein
MPGLRRLLIAKLGEIALIFSGCGGIIRPAAVLRESTIAAGPALFERRAAMQTTLSHG